MKSTKNSSHDSLKLLSTIELDKVVQILSEIVLDLTKAKSLAVLIWDRDLESFSDRAVFGTHKQDFVQFVEAFVDNYQDSDVCLNVLDADTLDVDLSAELTPVVSYRVSQGHQLVGCLLVAGTLNLDKDRLEEQLNQYPLAEALSNAWEV